ncbi:MAG: hypothetical protein J6C53_01960 [Clostridia bacterium]|nr:hypothetical protein [Clostridia bacterium]
MTSNVDTGKKFKQIGITTLVLVLLACVGVVIWWVLVQFLAPDKVIYNSHTVDEIKLVDGETVVGKKNIIEVRYFSNDKGNGLEMLEIKFNEYYDETKKMSYSQGIQFVANSVEDSIEFRLTFKETSFVGFWNLFNKATWWGSFDSLTNGSVHTYASVDDYYSTLGDAKALGGNDDFLIELGDDLYLMEFQGTNTKKSDDTRFAELDTEIVTVYAYHDVFFMAKQIYEQVQTLGNGKMGTTAFNFGEMFDFKHYENGAYLSETDRDTLKVDVRVKDYYVIYVETYEDGARQASDSMFYNIKGSPNFTLDGNYIEDGYFVGKSTINVTQDNFERVLVNNNQIALKLKQDFIDKVKPYKDNIQLSIVIDCDALADEGYDFIGFTADSAHKNYTIKKCVTVRTVDGQRVEEVIA